MTWYDSTAMLVGCLTGTPVSSLITDHLTERCLALQTAIYGPMICLQHEDSKTTVCLQVFAFTAPYSQRIEKTKESKVPCPWYRPEDGLKFIEAHGLGVRAVGKPQPALHCVMSSSRSTLSPQVPPECLEEPLKGDLRQRMQLHELNMQSNVPSLPPP